MLAFPTPCGCVMDVTCDRCKTRYEFDAALVSSRGTTVKCTSCGYQFRVFRPAGAGGLTGWTVRRGDGSELRFLAMRELQGAIASGSVGEADLLLPDDGSAPQTLGAIEELRSFFVSATAAPSDRGAAPRDGSVAEEGDTTKRHRREAGVSLPGIPIPAAAPQPLPRTMPSPSSARIAIPAPKPPRVAVSPDDIDMLETNPQLPKIDLSALGGAKLGSTAIGLAAPVKPPAPKRPAGDSQPPSSNDASGPFSGPDLESDVRDALDRVSIAIRESIPPHDSEPGRSSPAASAKEPRSSAQEREGDAEETAKRSSIDPLAGRLSSEPAPSSVARPSVLRRSSDGGDPRFSEYGRRTSRVGGFGRWALGLIVLGVGALVAVTALRNLESGKNPTAAVDDGKVARYLSEGDKLLHDGDVEGAKEQFAKASGLAENDPRVLQALARVAVLQADRVWIRGRVAGKGSEDLARWTDRAERAVEAASKAAKGNTSTAVLEIDVLRMKGRQADARKLVSRVGAGDLEGTRALAALDLTEPEPAWDSVIERLAKAAAAENKLGHAQALFVYALARRGPSDVAKRELGKLDEQLVGTPLVEALRAAIEKTPSATASASTSADEAPEVAELVKKASAAQKKAHHDEAEKLFKKALDKAPKNVDALLGLAEVSRAKGDATTAEKRFEAVLEVAPDSGAALAALGDFKWRKGDKSAAVERYRAVLDRAPTSSFADQARKRIADFEKANAAPPAPAAAPTVAPKPIAKPGGKPAKPVKPKPPTHSSHPGHPDIDTTDLPE